MTHDCGWIDLLRADGSGTLARGHLLVSGIPQPQEPWRGYLDSLHLAPAVSEVAAGEYLIGFAPGLQRLRVHVEVTDGRAAVCGEAGELPARLVELAEGE